jgi:hypothetical protein
MEEQILKIDLGQDGVLFVDESMVNFDDLINHKPGGIVRCFCNPNEAVLWIRRNNEEDKETAEEVLTQTDEPFGTGKLIPESIVEFVRSNR